MNRFLLSAVSLLMLTTNISAANGDYTRGIGVYPGRPSENFSPIMVKDTTYRNLALNRAVYQSSAHDYNLTGQLITDGIKTKDEPARLDVSTNGGMLDLRNREKTIDDNIITFVDLTGEDSYIQFDWTGMSVEADEITVKGEVAYNATAATGGYKLTVLASKDGKAWSVISELAGKGLPGKAVQREQSTDPNKQGKEEVLPLRSFDESFNIKPGTYSHIKVQLTMKGCESLRLKETAFLLSGKRVEVMPSYHFTSNWLSAGEGTQWVTVDLGTEADFNQINLSWVHKALQGEVQVSNDTVNWKTIAHLPNGKLRMFNGDPLYTQMACEGHGRYVRILMTQPDATGRYALSELEIMGRGGLVAQPNPRKGIGGGTYSLNGGDWRLTREGSTQSITATVPATVLTSYMNVGAVPNTVFSDNLKLISESFFNSDFTYRTHFDLPTDYSTKHVFLNFDGVNWKAEVFLNGQRLGKIDGAFMRGRFDITNAVWFTDNLLEVKVIHNAHFGAVKTKNMTSTDFNGGVLGADNPTFHSSIGWDWITTTPGREVGIWNDVYLTGTDGVSVSDPLVTTTLSDGDTLATVTPSVIVENAANEAVSAVVEGWIGGIWFSQDVRLQAHEKQEIMFNPDDFAQLKNQKLRLWWPNGYGEPYLYDAGFMVLVDGIASDSVLYKAGIREVTYKDINTETKIYVNGKRVTPLGGNWGFSETNLNYRGREYDAAVRYHKEMNFNMIRDWVGQIGDEEFYQACDKYGIMVWQDFWLANPSDGPDPYDETMFLANAKDYIYRIRNHPSITIYVGRNEGYPPATIDKVLREYIAAEHPQLGYISSSADDGVSGHGPYRALSATEYFSNQTHKFHSERGMPNVPTFESLQRMLKPADFWPQNIQWAKHDFTMGGAQQGASFDDIVAKHFGEAKDAEEFSGWAQWVNYDGYRAMYESAQQDRMGLLIWMSHPCWPTMVWQTYDYYLEPTAAYFGVKKACEPLHIQYNPVRRSVEVVDLGAGSHKGLTAQAQVLDMYGKVISEHSEDIDIKEDQTIEADNITLPNDSVYYIRLSLKDGGEVLSDNFYVQGQETDNLRALGMLPNVTLETKGGCGEVGDKYMFAVELYNPSDTPALMVRLNLMGDDGKQILPAIYSDNYFSLMPKERKIIPIEYRDEDGRGVNPHVEVSGFNVGKNETYPTEPVRVVMKQ